ncbi:MAG TPA: class I SAM-dependent methyltransferase [Actinomycetota bacterium]|nr:class I SAM-dependent methyltransferase [Actinomycetota bacterium]
MPSERVRHARRLFAGIAPGYDGMSEILSFGRNRHWRSFLISRVDLPAGARVLDVATGTAAVAIHLARERGLRVIGLDQSEPMLRSGRRRAAAAGLDVPLVLGRAEELPFGDGAFDGVTFTYLLRYVDDPQATLRELGRVLRPGGVMASLEFHVPEHPIWRAGWYAHTRVGLPLAGRVASRHWYGAGRFLGPSIAGFVRRYPLAEQGRMWRRAGMARVWARTMTLGAAVVIWGVKR